MRTGHEHGKGVLVAVELQVFPEQLIQDEVLVGQLWFGRSRVLLQRVEDLGPHTRAYTVQHTPALQRRFHGCSTAHRRNRHETHTSDACMYQKYLTGV